MDTILLSPGTLGVDPEEISVCDRFRHAPGTQIVRSDVVIVTTSSGETNRNRDMSWLNLATEDGARRRRQPLRQLRLRHARRDSATPAMVPRESGVFVTVRRSATSPPPAGA